MSINLSLPFSRSFFTDAGVRQRRQLRENRRAVACVRPCSEKASILTFTRPGIPPCWDTQQHGNRSPQTAQALRNLGSPLGDEIAGFQDRHRRVRRLPQWLRGSLEVCAEYRARIAQEDRPQPDRTFLDEFVPPKGTNPTSPCAPTMKEGKAPRWPRSV